MGFGGVLDDSGSFTAASASFRDLSKHFFFANASISGGLEVVVSKEFMALEGQGGLEVFLKGLKHIQEVSEELLGVLGDLRCLTRDFQ